ncbi:MAG TPA: hypothetical protein VGG24_16300 [Paraburkholderia sp.]
MLEQTSECKAGRSKDPHRLSRRWRRRRFLGIERCRADTQRNPAQPAALEFARNGFADIGHLRIQLEIGVRVGCARFVYGHGLCIVTEFALEKVPHFLFATGFGNVPDRNVHGDSTKTARTICPHGHRHELCTPLRARERRVTEQAGRDHHEDKGCKHFNASRFLSTAIRII